jgi:hypothetical protein
MSEKPNDDTSITKEEESDELSNTLIDVMWSVDHENILVEWADKAMCYRWLHGRANASFSKKNTWYTIPVIIISTLTGTANFAQDRVPIEYQGYFVMTVGGFNILAGIITTIQQFLKITQLNEAHRVASIAWDKFYRNIKIELAKHPKERLPVIQFLKMCKEEYDRLMETSPVIPEDIIDQFNKAFSSQGKTFEEIAKPEICDSLISTKNSRNPWYTEEAQAKQQTKQFRDNMSKAAEAKKLHAFNRDVVLTFKRSFHNLNNREPLDEEVIENLQHQISPNIVRDILLELSRLGINYLNIELSEHDIHTTTTGSLSVRNDENV